MKKIILSITAASMLLFSCAHKPTKEEKEAEIARIADSIRAVDEAAINEGPAAATKSENVATAEALAQPMEAITIDPEGASNLRAEPTMNGDIVASVPDGSQVLVLGKSGNWRKVQYQNKIGFIHQKLITTTQDDADRAAQAASDRAAKRVADSIASLTPYENISGHWTNEGDISQEEVMELFITQSGSEINGGIGGRMFSGIVEGNTAKIEVMTSRGYVNSTGTLTLKGKKLYFKLIKDGGLMPKEATFWK